MSKIAGTFFNARYRLEDEIGQGGMGVVYRAHDTLLDRDVALKVLSKAALGTEGRARLLREARSAAQLNHPNIVAIYDAGEADDKPFIVMELVEGQSLFERPPDDLDETVEITRQICAALDHAHTNGIVHRDLKPENVILTADGSVKLTDFGLALSVASRLTAEGSIAGTVFYIAPEVALGQPVDGRTDLYALGVMLYELTTDCLPFTADEPLAVISQHLHAPLVPPHAHQPDIPPALDALIVRLLSKQPQDRPASAREVAELLENLEAVGTAAQQLDLLDRVVRGRLIGREQEQVEMNALWRRVAVSGEGQVLLVSGEPGIGKTRLVRELVTRAAVSGGRVLMGECYAEGGMPYAPFAQIIQETGREPSGNGLDLPDFVWSDLVRIAPALRAGRSDLPTDPPLDSPSEQQRVFESVVAWIAALAAQAPVLLFVDDVHWAGSDTLYLLRHLARRARHLRLLIVLTYREVELDEAGPLQTVLHDFNRERLAARIKLTRFEQGQTREMLAAMLTPVGQVDESLVEAIHRETEGNPFFIEEVCKGLIEEEKLAFEEGYWLAPHIERLQIPQSVRVTVQSRLARLPRATQDVLRTAAILGREFDFEILRQASNLEEETLIDALEQAEQAQVIAETRRSTVLTPSFAFAHALIPSTLRDSTSVLRRQRLHRRVATAIAAAQPDDFEALAYHYEHAGDADRAQTYYSQAGKRALNVYAYKEAERNYRAALELSQIASDARPAGGNGRDGKQRADGQARLLAELGETLFRQSRYAEAGSVWREAIELYHAAGDHDNVARLYARAARATWYAGDAPGGLALCREGMAAVPEGLETPGTATLVHETARAFFFNDQPEEALPLCQQALEMAERLGLVEVQADTLATLGLLPNQPFEAKRQALQEAVDLAESAGLLSIASRAHLNLGGRLQEVGEHATARKHFLRARELAQQMGIAAWEHGFLASAVEAALAVGDLTSAEEDLETLRRLEEAVPNPESAALHTKLLQTFFLRQRGAWEAALELLESYPAEAQEKENAKLIAAAKTQAADLLLELDRLEEAEVALLQAIRISEQLPHAHWVTLWGLMSILRTRQGRLEEAHRALDQAREQLEPESNPADEGLIHWVAALLAAAKERWPEAMASFENAAQRIQAGDQRWYLARVLSDWAEVHRGRGTAEDQGRAEELLQEALAIFEALDARPYVAQIRERLKASPSPNPTQR